MVDYSFQHASLRPAIRPRHLLYIATRIGAFFAGLAILVLLGLIWSRGNPMLSAPSMALALILIGMLGMQLHARRRLRAQLVLQHVATAVQLRLPLPPYLRATAQAESPGVAKRLRRMATLLEEGATCGTAFHLATGEMELRIAGRLDAAQETGHLASTLHQLTQPREDAPRGGLNASMAYVLAVLITFFTAFTIISIFVLPKFEAIMHDFGVRPPLSMRILTDISPLLLSLMVVLVSIAVLITLTHSTRILFTSRQMPTWRRGFVDRLNWYTPMLRQLTRDQAYSDLAWTLHGALKAGHTLEYAMSVQMRAGINRVLRGKIIHMNTLMLGGADTASAANDAGFPPLLVSLLKQEAQPDLVKAMEFAGNAYASRHTRIAVTFRAVLPALLTFVFAMMVAGVAFSLFTPMVMLIDAMTPAFKGVQ